MRLPIRYQINGLGYSLRVNDRTPLHPPGGPVSTGFQPINIDALAGLTLHFRADIGLTSSANKVTQILNLAPGKLRVSASTILNAPITSSAFSSVTPIVPYFSRSATLENFYDDTNPGTGTLGSYINADQWHAFAVVNIQSTGAAFTIQGPALCGNGTRDWCLMTIEPLGLRCIMSGATSPQASTNYLAYSTGTNYVMEASYGALAPFSLSMALNGGQFVSGNVGSNFEATQLGRGLLIGTQNPIVANVSDTHVAEMCLFSKSLDVTTATNIRKTLGLRWGITVV